LVQGISRFVLLHRYVASMSGSLQLFLVALACQAFGCRAHWRLTKPVPRVGAGVYENNPLGSNTGENWVCRHASPNPNIQRPTFKAGQTFEIEYGGGATFGHVGDCAVYVSYDSSRPRRTMRWVKIANLPDCRAQINQDVPLVLPAELPSGEAVLRWEQLALHQGTFIEWFVQCADIIIDSSSTRSWESFNSFNLINNNGVPAHPSDISQYRRNTAVPGDTDFFMTGPACVDDSINRCALTASGTRGFTGFGAVSTSPSPPTSPLLPAPVPVPVPTPTIPPSPYDVYPVPTPTVPPSPYDAYPSPSPTYAATPAAPPAEAEAQCCFSGGCSSYGTSSCYAVGTWCSQSSENCQLCAGTYCSEMDWWNTQPSTPPNSNPIAEGQCCLVGGCGSASCIDGGVWCSESSGNCQMCQGTFCTRTSLLSKLRLRKHSLRHQQDHQGELALMQANLTFHKFPQRRIQHDDL